MELKTLVYEKRKNMLVGRMVKKMGSELEEIILIRKIYSKLEEWGSAAAWAMRQ